jgi:hypothetical protein
MRRNPRARALSSTAPFLAVALSLASLLGSASPARADDTARLRTPTLPEPERASWFRVTGTLGAGLGLRFNNPYRLATPLGANAESVSRTAAYVDAGVALSFGDPEGIVHGPVLRWDHAAQGVGQDVLTPSYALGKRWLTWETWGRVGVPLVLRPDVSAGGELAVGGAWFATQGLGAWGELVGDLFFGAGTLDAKRPTYPVLSLQVGAIFEWERLP